MSIFTHKCVDFMSSSHSNMVIISCLYISGVAQHSDISQPVPFQTVKLGDSATIECHIKSEMGKRVWYKTTGKKLQLVVEINSSYNVSVFSAEFHHRYSVRFDKFISNLSISATTWEDVGTYFCGVMHFNSIKFGPGTFLMLKGIHFQDFTLIANSFQLCLNRILMIRLL